jgi:hypothetical protein
LPLNFSFHLSGQAFSSLIKYFSSIMVKKHLSFGRIGKIATRAS